MAEHKTRSEDVLGQKYDTCIADTIIKTGKYIFMLKVYNIVRIMQK